MIDLSGKVALVTGAGRGIGKGCALAMARAGATLVINDRPDNPNLDNTAAEIRALGQTAYPVGADVFSRAGCEFLVAEALRLAGHIDILVSNPARSTRYKLVK